MPTIREADGLGNEQPERIPVRRGARGRAGGVPGAMRGGVAVGDSGDRDAGRLRTAALKFAERQEPLVSGVDYVSVVDAETMAWVGVATGGRRVMIAAAVRLGTVRLIDNVVVSV